MKYVRCRVTSNTLGAITFTSSLEWDAAETVKLIIGKNKNALSNLSGNLVLIDTAEYISQARCTVLLNTLDLQNNWKHTVAPLSVICVARYYVFVKVI